MACSNALSALICSCCPWGAAACSSGFLQGAFNLYQLPVVIKPASCIITGVISTHQHCAWTAASVKAHLAQAPLRPTALSLATAKHKNSECVHCLDVLADDGTVLTWGRGEDGQLGHGGAAAEEEPRAVYGLLNRGVSAVVCGAEYSVAVSGQEKQVYSWGW